ncbi:MAG: hypothetical protein IPP48_07750 [Chitinophagaceae bacterium]|nr:hypothetical protein [Chitinophagaceae bacterium]
MKKITAILFFSIYLFATTGLNELFKLNALVQHFYETKAQDNSIDLLHFLVMHYITDDLNDADNSQDEQLPFKTTENCIAGNLSLNIPEQYFSLQATPVAIIVTQQNFVTPKDLSILSICNVLVWHPPKYLSA